jgi:diacylglycerol kinase
MLDQIVKERELKENKLFLNDVIGRSSLLKSFGHAGRGLRYALSTQRNLRIQIVVGGFVLVAGFLYQVSMLEMLLLWLAIVLVIACEIINTALELTLDIVSGGKFHALVKVTKDVVAAGVLLAAINAVVIGVIIFARYI